MSDTTIEHSEPSDKLHSEKGNAEINIETLTDSIREFLGARIQRNRIKHEAFTHALRLHLATVAASAFIAGGGKELNSSDSGFRTGEDIDEELNAIRNKIAKEGAESIEYRTFNGVISKQIQMFFSRKGETLDYETEKTRAKELLSTINLPTTLADPLSDYDF